MATKNVHVVPFRRKREGKTNYKKRLKLLLSHKARLLVRKSLKNILIQVAEYGEQGDKVIMTVSSKMLERDYGWKNSRGNVPAAYLTGLLAGLKAKEKGIKEAILDTGLQQSSVKGSRIYAAIKGVIDSGLMIPCSEEMFPNEETMNGKNIARFATQLKKEKPEEYKKQFSKYLKNNLNPEDISTLFENTKKKLISNFKG